MENDDSIKMSVGLQNLLSIDFELEHINYNCRGTIKGLITFNYIHIPIKYVEVQLLKKEDIFIDKTKKEPIIIEDIELIDGNPDKLDTIPFRIFLKSYNLTPTYKNVNNIFSLKYYVNLIIGDFNNNTFFKQTEIKLFRIFRIKPNPDLNYGPWEEFISEPMYNEEYFIENNDKKENEGKDKDKDKDLNNIFNDENNEIEEEEYEEEDESDEDEENLENDNLNNDEFIISTSSEEAKKKEEEKSNKKNKKNKKSKSSIVNILRSNSLYKSDNKNKDNNNIINNNDNIINNINIPFNDENDNEDNYYEGNKYMNSLITSNFPSNSDNNLFNDDSNINMDNNNRINKNSQNNNNVGKTIKFDD